METNLKDLQSELTKKQTDVTRLTTDSTKANAHNAELGHALKRTHQNVAASQTTAREAGMSVVDIEGAVANSRIRVSLMSPFAIFSLRGMLM